MSQKLSLQKFRQIKDKFINNSIDIQNELLSYDLSDIPFEEWRGIRFNYLADEYNFSKTHANIDFEIFDPKNCYSISSLKGCNIKNLYRLENNVLPKIFDKNVIKNYSSSLPSNLFNEEFLNKYNNQTLSIQDLVDLNEEQLQLLKEKNISKHLNRDEKSPIKIFELDKLIELFNYSKKDYEFVISVINFSTKIPYVYNPYVYNKNFKWTLLDEISNHSKEIKISEMKEVCNTYLKEMILDNSIEFLFPEKFPKEFVEENKDLFLLNDSVDEDLKYRFYKRVLSIDDVIENISLFKKIPIENFMDDTIFEDIAKALGKNKLIDVIEKYPDFMKYISDTVYPYSFVRYLAYSNLDSERKFVFAVKKYYLNHYRPLYDIPDFIMSMGFKVVNSLETVEDLMNYTDMTLLLDSKQQNLVDIFGIDNIKKLEEETKLFSNESQPKELEIFKIISICLNQNKYVNEIRRYEDAYSEFYGMSISFKNGTLPYSEFRNKFAELLDLMRSKKVFENTFTNYDCIQGKFREDYPEIFIDQSAPLALKYSFYNGDLSLSKLYEFKNFLHYFNDKNLVNVINDTILLDSTQVSPNGIEFHAGFDDFILQYTKKYGNQKLLNIISKYGNFLSNLVVKKNMELDDEQEIEKNIRQAVYKVIKSSNKDYSDLQNVPEFINEYPELFVDFKQIPDIPSEYLQRLEASYYIGELIPDDIKNHPQLVDVLKDKDLKRCFYTVSIHNSELDLLSVYGNESFLKLCAKYGRFITNITKKLEKEFVLVSSSKFVKYNKITRQKEKELTFNEIDKIIEDIICKESILGNIDYNEYNAPLFLKERHPELFLNEDAPEVLKDCFYNNGINMTPRALSENYETWKRYLKGKSIKTALLRNIMLHKELLYFFELFDESVAIKLIIDKPKTITEMLYNQKVDIIKKWYDKTGKKFIPDHVVMMNFDISQIDKFLSSASKWSRLMKIKDFTEDTESKEAMLKLAYSFGVFDNDQRGFKKLQDLLIGIPRKISKDNYLIINRINDEIDKYSKRYDFFKIHKNSEISSYKEKGEISNSKDKEKSYNEMIEYIKNSDFINYDIINKETLISLFSSLKEEIPNIDLSEKIFSQIYKFNEDGTHTLIINPQSCPKTTEIVRSVLEKFVSLKIVTPQKAHQLFGGFKMEYDPEFREFLLDNLDKILKNAGYSIYIASIQKQFKDIKKANINRKLTLDLAVSYVQQNKYGNVEVGNDKVAEISAIAGYTQEDFDTLQKIYNYGKQRVFSSIPRIEGNTEKYTYEMLRLDDPLAMAIGTLTDCCQEIGNVAETCMEHSMVDKNGRVFVIKDKEGNIISQSWVWRNKDVICFDNVEIPDKAFKRADDRKSITEEVYKMYKLAAHELIEKDKKDYKKLLESGKITEEQYEGLVLSKVTVGLGYNDIAQAIKKQAKYDSDISRPLLFKPPVQLRRNLYTSDSEIQYILDEEQKNNTYNGDTLPIYSDSYIEYDDLNFDYKKLLSLNKLEMQTKGNSNNLDIFVDENNENKIITEIAYNYDLNSDATNIIMNANFGIIYEYDTGKIKIADILYNTKMQNEGKEIDIEPVVILQIRLALEQIGKNKEIDISNLDDISKEIYNKAMKLTEDNIDEERGVVYEKQY